MPSFIRKILEISGYRLSTNLTSANVILHLRFIERMNSNQCSMQLPPTKGAQTTSKRRPTNYCANNNEKQAEKNKPTDQQTFHRSTGYTSAALVVVRNAFHSTTCYSGRSWNYPPSLNFCKATYQPNQSRMNVTK